MRATQAFQLKTDKLIFVILNLIFCYIASNFSSS